MWKGPRRNIRRPWRSGDPIRRWVFPNTAYYLPVIYAILGIPVQKLSDMKPVLEPMSGLLPPLVKEKVALPYLAPALDAGMATFFAEEIIEAIRYLRGSQFLYKTGRPYWPNNIWLGAADDVIFRKRGVEFVDGTAPGFAAIVGAAPYAGDGKKDRTRTAGEESLRLHVRGERAENVFRNSW